MLCIHNGFTTNPTDEDMLALKPHTGNCFLILATRSAEAPRERRKKHKTTELPVIKRLITKQILVSFPTICFVLVWDFCAHSQLNPVWLHQTVKSICKITTQFSLCQNYIHHTIAKDNCTPVANANV